MSGPILELTLNRNKPGPWGFRLQGGVDFEKALTVIFVNEGSFSYNSGLRNGDVIVKIGQLEGGLLTHKEAQEAVIEQGNSVHLTVKRQSAGPPTLPEGVWKPDVQLVGGPAVHAGDDRTYTKTSLTVQPKFEEEHFDVKHNITAKGFTPGGSGSGIRSVAAPVTRPQASAPAQGFKSVAAPQGGVSDGAGRGPPVCWVCSKQITGIFLQANGQPLCGDCFNCVSCRSSLRNIGHFVVGGQLYCQKCGREAQNKLRGKSDGESSGEGAPVVSNGQGSTPGGSMPQNLAANLARLTMKPPAQKVAPVPQPPRAANNSSGKANWENRLNANTAGMATNAEDFTKEFMKELTGGTGV